MNGGGSVIADASMATSGAKYRWVVGKKYSDFYPGQKTIFS